MLETLHDRLYGTIELPPSARRLASTCPLLLRLREVRMPNTPFVTFPSFANVSRYEHSLGVAHLAWWWARRAGLADDVAETLTLGALYHDAATPAFSHLFEEFLSRNRFDHENALADVLSAQPSTPGGMYSQVFLGRSARLRDELAQRDPSGPPVTATEVGLVATGRHPLGPLLHGEVDLDNIDNVIRAVTAMGIVPGGFAPHPYEVAAALVLEGGEVRLSPSGRPLVQKWQDLRRILYGSILESREEFLAQATIKWAIEECYSTDRRLSEPDAWCLTEPELIFEHLRAVPRSRVLIDRSRLGSPAPLLFSAWVEDLRPFLGPDSEKTTKELCSRLREIWGVDTYVSLIRDKRERQVTLDVAEPWTLFDHDQVGHGEQSSPSDSSSGRSDWSGLLGAVGLRLDQSAQYPRRLSRDRALIETGHQLKDDFGLEVLALRTHWLGLGAQKAGRRWA